MNKMQPHHEKVLAALDACTRPHGEYCAHFSMIAQEAEISDVREIRRITRHLARKGYAEFFKGLCNEDGEFCGAGYCITPAGRAALEAKS